MSWSCLIFTDDIHFQMVNPIFKRGLYRTCYYRLVNSLFGYGLEYGWLEKIWDHLLMPLWYNSTYLLPAGPATALREKGSRWTSQGSPGACGDVENDPWASLMLFLSDYFSKPVPHDTGKKLHTMPDYAVRYDQKRMAKSAHQFN